MRRMSALKAHDAARIPATESARLFTICEIAR
jgi:hypothetical protein